MSNSPKPSRREFLRGWLAGVEGHNPRRPPAGARAPARNPDARAAPSPGRPNPARGYVTLPIHRPPGAVDEGTFLAHCTRCNECIRACPVQAIVLAPPRFRHAAGTPMIDACASPCVMCVDTPCITACKPGVLRAEQPLKMGVAYIERAACLAHTGSFCTVCAERCPVADAIELTDGKPRIRPDTCTGCGVCAFVCPAPSNAVVVMPLADRPLNGRRV